MPDITSQRRREPCLDAAIASQSASHLNVFRRRALGLCVVHFVYPKTGPLLGTCTNRAAWPSALACFPTGLRSIWRIACLSATRLSFFLPAAHRDRLPRHASRQSHSRPCSFDNRPFAQTLLPPVQRAFFPLARAGLAKCRCTARVYKLGIVLK